MLPHIELPQAVHQYSKNTGTKNTSYAFEVVTVQVREATWPAQFRDQTYKMDQRGGVGLAVAGWLPASEPLCRPENQASMAVLQSLPSPFFLNYLGLLILCASGSQL